VRVRWFQGLLGRRMPHAPCVSLAGTPPCFAAVAPCNSGHRAPLALPHRPRLAGLGPCNYPFPIPRSRAGVAGAPAPPVGLPPPGFPCGAVDDGASQRHASPGIADPSADAMSPCRGGLPAWPLARRSRAGSGAGGQ